VIDYFEKKYILTIFEKLIKMVNLIYQYIKMQLDCGGKIVQKDPTVIYM